MEEIVFVTYNKGKVKSAERYFDNIKFSIYDFELEESRSNNIKEIIRGNSYENRNRFGWSSNR